MGENAVMIQAALIGAGKRGMLAYASYALKRPDEIQFIAVAEPNEERRNLFSKLHHIPTEMQFASWEELLAKPKLCEALLICTMDREHYAPTMAALDKGYHILLEKPMSHDPLEAIRIAEKAEETQRILTVCHGMRYNTFSSELKRLIDAKLIGDIMTIQWTENVGHEHYVSSFVRGNWRNSQESSSMILQKSCHDMDMLQWIIGAKCTKVSSFGKLTYFRPENAPEGSTERCTDGCAVEQDCPWSAIKNYYNTKSGGWYNAVSLDNSLDVRMKAIKEGPYGRCVFRCDNDVVDHQIVNLEFENEATVSFTMSGFTKNMARTYKVMGTLGEIRGTRDVNEIEINYFNGKQERYYPQQIAGGHQGSDVLIMRDFIAQVKSGNLHSKTSATESARSHMIAFAAEHSRVTGQTIDLDEYIELIKSGGAAVSNQ
jgi:predicted dehydrogenase